MGRIFEEKCVCDSEATHGVQSVPACKHLERSFISCNSYLQSYIFFSSIEVIKIIIITKKK